MKATTKVFALIAAQKRRAKMGKIIMGSTNDHPLGATKLMGDAFKGP